MCRWLLSLAVYRDYLRRFLKKYKFGHLWGLDGRMGAGHEQLFFKVLTCS